MRFFDRDVPLWPLMEFDPFAPLAPAPPMRCGKTWTTWWAPVGGTPGRGRGLYLLGLCFAVAVAVHVGMMLRSFDLVRETAERPLTTRFVQRRPRLTKPMELRKQPRPRQRQMVRQQVQVQARASRLTGSRWGGSRCAP